MRCVCVFKVLVCVVFFSFCSSFWLLLNKRAFSSFELAVGSFADHLTPVLTCFWTGSLSHPPLQKKLIIGGGYHYHLHPCPDTVAGERSCCHHPCCHHPLHHQSAPPLWMWTWTHWYPLIRLNEQTVHLTFVEKRKIKSKSSSWLLQCCKNETDLDTRNHAQHICAGEKGKWPNNQPFANNQCSPFQNQPSESLHHFMSWWASTHCLKLATVRSLYWKCPGEVQHFDISTPVLFL